MPLTVVLEKELPRIGRKSKIMAMPELIELMDILEKGLKSGQVVRMTFSPETLRKHFKNNAEKAATAVAVRLRRDIGEYYKVQIAGGIEVRVSHKSKK